MRESSSPIYTSITWYISKAASIPASSVFRWVETAPYLLQMSFFCLPTLTSMFLFSGCFCSSSMLSHPGQDSLTMYLFHTVSLFLPNLFCSLFSEGDFPQCLLNLDMSVPLKTPREVSLYSLIIDGAPEEQVLVFLFWGVF